MVGVIGLEPMKPIRARDLQSLAVAAVPYSREMGALVCPLEESYITLSRRGLKRKYEIQRLHWVATVPRLNRFKPNSKIQYAENSLLDSSTPALWFTLKWRLKRRECLAMCAY